MKSKTVTIIYKYIPQYRKEFFNLLRNKLSKKNIKLELIYGQPGKYDLLRQDSVDIIWARKIQNRVFEIFGKEFYWQPVIKYTKNSDLVIVEQASKLLINFYLLWLNMINKKKIALWGHGINLQKSSASKLGENIKKVFTSKAHWFFAYTESGALIVRENGFPKEKITITQNAFDTNIIRKFKQEISDEQLQELRNKLEIKSKNICLYAGAIYKEKKIDFLINACKQIRSIVSDFEIIIIGAGKDTNILNQFMKENSWVHYIGPKFGVEKVPYFLISKLFLMPGAVGLAILDCFALGLPMITTKNNNHGPEIDYIENGENGVIIDDSINKNLFVETVIDLIGDNDKLQKLSMGCIRSASIYTIESMVNNFYEGVLKALETNEKIF